MFKHILVPTDGSKLAGEMATHAIDLARSQGARITFFHASAESVGDFYGGEGTLIDQVSREDLAAAEDQRARKLFDDLQSRARAAGVDCAARAARSDQPHQAIIDAAHELGCDLIFMASHGRRGIKALILGSQTQRVLTHSKIPVLVYR